MEGQPPTRPSRYSPKGTREQRDSYDSRWRVMNSPTQTP